MAAATTSSKSKGPIVDPALCRCCRSIKKCRLLTAEYEWNGSKEVYSDMFMDFFGLMFSHLDGGDPKDSCICATCVVRLRDAGAFRRQVLQCEQAFMNAKIERDECESKVNMIVNVKSEPMCGNASDSDCGDMGATDAVCDNIEPDQESKLDNPTDANSDVKQMNLRKRRKVRETTEKVKKKAEKRHARIKRKLESKLDKYCIEKPAAPPLKKPKLTSNVVVERRLEDDLMYENALTIACNSYVTPFINRISIYYCYYCRDQFTDPAELRRHTLTHDPEKQFKHMMENKRVPKMDITRIDCRLCEEKIHDLFSLKKHLQEIHCLKIHDVNNEFLTFKLELEEVSCTECEATFPYFDMLKKHMIEHFGSLICDQCGACFLEVASLRTHIKTHNKIEVLFPCEICGKNLKSKYSMIQHILTIHEKKPTVNCYKCDAMFLSHALRNKHLIEVHGDKRTFPCKFCDKVYNRRKTLAEHNRRNHAKVFRHQCDLCDQKFYVPSRLKEHMATHTGERNYRCDTCDKSYPRLQSLQEHMRSHTNERKYKCDICNASFTQNGSLKSHVKNHHQAYDLDSVSVKFFGSVSTE